MKQDWVNAIAHPLYPKTLARTGTVNHHVAETTHWWNRPDITGLGLSLWVTVNQPRFYPEGMLKPRDD